MPLELATETRNESYKKVKETLGAKQALVLQSLVSAGAPLTNNEIARRLSWPINSVTGRVYELRDKKKVEAAGKRVCTVSGETCMTWRPAA